MERGERPIVGVNCFPDASEPLPIETPDYASLARDQLARLRAVKAARDDARVAGALDRLRAAAKAPAPRVATPLMPLIIEAVRARGTVGEIADALSDAWGVHHPTA